MLKRKLRRGDIFLIIANLLPVYGVAFLGWSAVDAFIVYALETLIIGVITVLKILLVTTVRHGTNFHILRNSRHNQTRQRNDSFLLSLV
jgi:Family of unknown function (DUF6498)